MYENELMNGAIDEALNAAEANMNQVLIMILQLQ